MRHEVAQLIEQARGGSSRARGHLFERCRGYLLAVARRRLGPDLRRRTRPSDVVQDTVIAADACFERFNGRTERELLAWLCGILLNVVSDHAKYLRRVKRDVSRELSLERDLDGAARDGLVADVQSAPSHALARDEDAQRLVAALGRLALEQRQVIVLRNWEGLPWSEVGARMQRSSEAARKLWVRSIEALRGVLELPDGRSA